MIVPVKLPELIQVFLYQLLLFRGGTQFHSLDKPPVLGFTDRSHDSFY